MSYTKRYNLDKLHEQIAEMAATGKKSVDLEDLLFLVAGFEPKDVNKFYIKHIKHRFRYSEEKRENYGRYNL